MTETSCGFSKLLGGDHRCRRIIALLCLLSPGTVLGVPAEPPHTASRTAVVDKSGVSERDDANERFLKLIRGDWHEVFYRKDGRTFVEHEDAVWKLSPARAHRWVLEPEPPVWILGTMTVDATTKPIRVDFRRRSRGEERVIPGIAKFAGNRLVIALREDAKCSPNDAGEYPERPMSFAATQENKVTVYTLDRAHDSVESLVLEVVGDRYPLRGQPTERSPDSRNDTHPPGSLNSLSRITSMSLSQQGRAGKRLLQLLDEPQSLTGWQQIRVRAFVRRFGLNQAGINVLPKEMNGVVWSKPKRGIQLGVNNLRRPLHFQNHEPIVVDSFIRNVGDNTIEVTIHGLCDSVPAIRSSAGEAVTFTQGNRFFTKMPPVTRRLAPGAAFAIGPPAIHRLGSNEWTPQQQRVCWIDPRPGRYSLELGLSIEVKSPDQGTPTRRETFTAGPVEFELAETQTEGRHR